jgi:hypothetical protein
MKMHVYFRHQKVTNNEDRITIALMALEGHPHSYMQEYSMAISKNLQLGTWAEFLLKLKTSYKDLALEKRAQQNLDKVDLKKYTNVRSFAEDFRIWAPKSGYSDVELIARINHKRSECLVNVMMGAEMANPALAPSTWARYLDYVLQFETKLCENRNANGMRSHKDLDAMEVNAMHTFTWPRGKEKELVLVSTPPFIIFALFFGLCVCRACSDFLIRKSFPFLALDLFQTCFNLLLSTCRCS